MKDIFQNRAVLVTGGAGFIGSNLAIRLCELGAHVTVVDDFNPHCGANSFNLSPVADKIKVVRESITNAASFLEGKKYGFIFNLAGNVSHIDSISHPLQDLSMNVTGQLSFLESVRKFTPHAKVIYASTRQVYGRARYFPVDENHPVSPPDINGVHKFCAEEYHRILHQVHGLKTVVLRLSNTYGPRQLIRSSRQGVAGVFLGNALRGEPIRLFSGGLQRRDFTFVDDVVQAFLLAATNAGCEGRIFNVASEAAPLRSFALALQARFPKLQIEESDFPKDRLAFDIGEVNGSAHLFRQTTGWIPAVSLPEGIGKTCEYYLGNLRHYA